MTRSEFLQMCTLLGIGLPLNASISGCKKGAVLREGDKVLILGAGAGGLTAAYQLIRKGVDVEILEASSSYGGRMKRTKSFTDFPIPLGAEWLHVERSVLDEIVDNPEVNLTTQTIGYDYQKDFALYNGTKVNMRDIGFNVDQKFINSTWFDFFETYVIPTVLDRIRFNQVVQTIDYSERIKVQTTDKNWEADRVIINIPIKLLQLGEVRFTPPLPEKKQNAIKNVKVWDGCKAFFEFTEKFYPAAAYFDTGPPVSGQKMYYDAAYGQNSDKHILGYFGVGQGTLPYVEQNEEVRTQFMLNELDELFDGRASNTYVKSIFQNWNQEPFAKGAYLTDQENWRLVRELGNPVGDKLFFAGDAYTDGEDWSSVHTAARSGIRAAQRLVG